MLFQFRQSTLISIVVNLTITAHKMLHYKNSGLCLSFSTQSKFLTVASELSTSNRLVIFEIPSHLLNIQVIFVVVTVSAIVAFLITNQLLLCTFGVSQKEEINALPEISLP